ncbi:MAG: hypothetical protein V1742_04790 [Pseudomonadota bacterium]
MLICEACGHEHEGRKCKDCNKTNPGDAKYCCYCGKRLPSRSSGKSSGKGRDDPYDLENRVLCSDGNCIGVINEQGVCCSCGLPAGADLEEEPAEAAE